MSAVLSSSSSPSAPANPNKALWEKGDFTRIAATMRESGESLVRSIGVKKGMNVLDLGGGDGTTALPAARLGAEVLVVDIARNLVAAGNKPDTVARVIQLVDRSEYKRRQAPPGVKITPRAFGRDRRMPIVNRYSPNGVRPVEGQPR